MIRPVAELLPHQPPMRLIERILAWDGSQLCAAATVDQMPVLVEGALTACYGLELMAQTAAAFFTLRADDTAAPRQGMLIACRKFDTQVAAYPAHAQLIIHAQLQSPLPTDASSSALVKFSGAIMVVDTAAPGPAAHDDVNQLAALCAEQAVSTASLSVYI